MALNHKLSIGQLSVMAAICLGSSIKEIAWTRGVSVRAVYDQALRCKRKLQLARKMPNLQAARFVIAEIYE